MISFIATLNVKEGREADFEAHQAELARLTHEQEPDVLVYDVIRHQEQARHYVVYARFKDQEAFDAHMAIDFHDRLVPLILDCVDGEMDLQFFNSIDG